jgi:hypothetical protein
MVAVRKADDGSLILHIPRVPVEQPPKIREAIDALGETVRKIRERHFQRELEDAMRQPLSQDVHSDSCRPRNTLVGPLWKCSCAASAETENAC